MSKFLELIGNNRLITSAIGGTIGYMHSPTTSAISTFLSYFIADSTKSYVGLGCTRLKDLPKMSFLNRLINIEMMLNSDPEQVLKLVNKLLEFRQKDKIRHKTLLRKKYIQNLIKEKNIKNPLMKEKFYNSFVELYEQEIKRYEESLELVHISDGTIISGSKNIVASYQKLYQDHTIAKFSKNLEDLKAEKQAAEIINKIRDHLISRKPAWDWFDVCTPITIDKLPEEFVYIIKHIECPNLEEIAEIAQRNTNLKIYKRVAKTTSGIHRLFPKGLIRGEERNISTTLESRIKLIEKDIFLSNLNPFEIIQETELAYNKDAHPRNFGINEDGYPIIIDTENNMPRRIVYDWTNLMDHNRYLDKQQKLEVMRSFIKGHKDLGVDLQVDTYRLAYLNAVCVRTLELYEILLNREEIKHTKDMVLNSLESLEIIEQEFPKYYTDFKKEYKNLKEGIDRIMQLIQIKENEETEQQNYKKVHIPIIKFIEDKWKIEASNERKMYASKIKVGMILTSLQEILFEHLWEPYFEVSAPLELIGKDYELEKYNIEDPGIPTIDKLNSKSFETKKILSISKFQLYKEMAIITARVHRFFPKNLIKEEERHLEDTLKDRLNSELAERIIPYISPLEESILETELAYSKNAHPGNFAINKKGHIIVLYTGNIEPRRIVYDWANITNHNRLLSQWLKDQVTRSAIETHKEFDVELNEEIYMRAYYNAGIARALELYRVLQERNEPEHNRALLLNSIDALERIKKNHRDYYAKYQTEYGHLREGINGMLLMVDSNSTSQKLTCP